MTGGECSPLLITDTRNLCTSSNVVIRDEDKFWQKQPNFDRRNLIDKSTGLWLVIFLPPECHCVWSGQITSPHILWSCQIVSKNNGTNECFGIVISKQLEIITDICHGQSITEQIKKKIETATAGYILLQIHYASYMLFCLVYEKTQNCFLATAGCPAWTKKYFGIWVSLFKVFNLLKTERGLAQKMPN